MTYLDERCREREPLLGHGGALPFFSCPASCSRPSGPSLPSRGLNPGGVLGTQRLPIGSVWSRRTRPRCLCSAQAWCYMPGIRPGTTRTWPLPHQLAFPRRHVIERLIELRGSTSTEVPEQKGSGSPGWGPRGMGMRPTRRRKELPGWPGGGRKSAGAEGTAGVKTCR